MIYTKAIFTAFAIPLMIAMFWQEGTCQQRKKTRETTKKMNSVQQGRWGGRGVVLDVTDSGASIEYDCSYGNINEPIVLDRNNRFEVKGTHVTERPGPVRIGREDGEQPAIYVGHVEGETMTLTVRFPDSKQIIGVHKLVYGKPARIRKCL